MYFIRLFTIFKIGTELQNFTARRRPRHSILSSHSVLGSAVAPVGLPEREVRSSDSETRQRTGRTRDVTGTLPDPLRTNQGHRGEVF